MEEKAASFQIKLFMAFDDFCKQQQDDGNPDFTGGWEPTREICRDLPPGSHLPFYAGHPVPLKICDDILKPGQQIPFDILFQVYRTLYKYNYNFDPSADCLRRIALQFLNQVRFGKAGADLNSIPKNPKNSLDLFHTSLTGESPVGEWGNTSFEKGTKFWLSKFRVHNASTLISNGVTLKEKSSGRPLDIEFTPFGCLRIPTFCITETNIGVLKNLLAYEKRSPEVMPYFSCLVVLFSNLIATDEDVKILRKAGIIQHKLSNDQKLVSLVRELYYHYSKGTCFYNSNYYPIKSEVERINRFVTSVVYAPNRLIAKLMIYTKRIVVSNFASILIALFVYLIFNFFLTSYL